MTKNIKILTWVGVLAVILAAGAFAYSLSAEDSSTNTSNNTSVNTTVANNQNKNSAAQNVNMALPAASSNLNTSVDAILQGAEAESTKVQEELVDETSLTTDSQALETYGQSYDENEF